MRNKLNIHMHVSLHIIQFVCLSFSNNSFLSNAEKLGTTMFINASTVTSIHMQCIGLKDLKDFLQIKPW